MMCLWLCVYSNIRLHGLVRLAGAAAPHRQRHALCLLLCVCVYVKFVFFPQSKRRVVSRGVGDPVILLLSVCASACACE